MDRQISDEQLLTEDLFPLQKSMGAFAEAVRFEIRLPAYHLNHRYIRDAEDAITKILNFKQKLEQLSPVERVDVGIAENKDICFNCTVEHGHQAFNSLEELSDFCEKSTLDIFRSYDIYDFDVRIYIRFITQT